MFRFLLNLLFGHNQKDDDMPKKFEPITSLNDQQWTKQQFEEGRIADAGIDGAYTFTVKDGDLVASTKDIDRAEMKLKKDVNDTIPMGKPIRIGFNLYIPRNMPHPGVPMGHMIFCQFHHYGTGSPKMSFQYLLEDGNDHLYMKVRESVEKARQDPFRGPFKLERGRMDQRLTFEGVFTSKSNGKLKVVHAIGNEVKQTLLYNGPTLYPKGGTVKEERLNLKVGIYRDGAYPDDQTIGIGAFKLEEM